MLPLQQAYEVKHSLIEYLKATFSFKDAGMHSAFHDFITHPTEGIFKGPYVSLKLPFTTLETTIGTGGAAGATAAIPLDIAPGFPPYHHQLRSFERLTTKEGHRPLSTLVTTGTSSGKTECFLYPVLDYCRRMAGREGIKVIILYPMNALATDQAKRMAEVIWNDDRLKGRVTAGLFIGEGKDKRSFETQMGEDYIIEHRQTIVDMPPDILLTNFKMLDYALMRSSFHNLWSRNLADPSLLRYLVLDELHTYDGAQGSDVANLIRRLKLKLSIKKGHLCAVGTSATIGSGEEAVELLTDYASKVFGEDFDREAVITEQRITVDAFFGRDDEALDAYVPRISGLLVSRLQENETYAGYIDRQKSLWQIPPGTGNTALGEELKKLRLVKDLLAITSQGVVHLDALQRRLADRNPAFGRLPEWDAAGAFNPREEVILSLLALISEARVGEGKQFPFLYLQIQLWVRELSGVLREVGTTPRFTWKDKVGERHEARALPAYFCRECGASGWLGIKDDNKNHFFSDPKQVYEYFFGNHKNTYFMNTPQHQPVEEYQAENLIREHMHVADLALHQKPGERTMEIIAVRKLRDNKSRHVCPECNTENTMGVIGTRVPTLSSITVSQALASDLDPRPDRDRKVLAFSNSVQDAAHQAGFIEARNYRFTFRASMQKVINSHEGPLRLTELFTLFTDYWKQHADATGRQQEEAYYYRFLPADYQAKMDLRTDYRDAANRLTAAFRQEFDLRMQWEMVSEFGYNALIGRTLEKSGASAVCFDPDRLLTIYPTMKKWMETNNLGMIGEEDFVPFVNGLLHRVRMRGGVDHPYLEKFRAGGLKLWDLNWMRDNRHFLNKLFHPRSRLPKPVGVVPHGRGLMDTTFTRANNWYRSYFLKAFPMAPAYADLLNEFYTTLFGVLVEAGLMNRMGDGELENHSIVPEAMLLENRVVMRVCDHCGSRLYTTPLARELSGGTPCLDYDCRGRYSREEKTPPNYYQLVYNRNFSPRIYAAEHTGLLERKDREDKETDFRERPRFNSLNAIVATSTLEMGINIGTLNTAINNSVPPLPANFLQRVGRAGRASGAALIVNFVQGKAHDLFYYEEPADMMEGEIATPGCFLEAKEILFRHFLAYCLDNWSAEDPAGNGIPGVMLTLQLARTDLSDPAFFANRVATYIETNENRLLKRFIDFYRPDMADARALESLQAYVKEGGLILHFRQVFVRLRDEYLGILGHIDDIREAMKVLPHDQERRELEAELKALWGLKRLLDRRAVLEHLTNMGLLPNYAFPETGVTLNAWVKAGRAKASEGLPTDQQFEIVRSSRSAIRELAPDNHFYSQGYKFAVTGLNTHDWKDPGTLIRKRFCSNCDHIGDAVGKPEPFCPKCGDASWASEKNQHVFVRLNGVKSVNFRDKSRLDDSKDERDSNPYRISRHLQFSPTSFQGAWGMQEIPFGIEYVREVTLTEVNMGLSSSVHANKVRINRQDDVPCHGFVSCRFCGKSTSRPNLPEQKFHYGYCRHKERVYSGKVDEVFEEVFLFREMQTEALKVLLPVQEFESEATINMFRAGLELGMKKYYKGNPQHIQFIDYAEYNRKNGRFDRYLVLVDTIPGGTGYLEKLFSPKEFTTVLGMAYEAIRTCRCQDQGKDGCYRCVFSYTNQYIQEELSRAKAERLFGVIVEKSEAWENYTSGLGALTGNGQIEESELEDRFIRSLRLYAEAGKEAGYAFGEFLEDGVVNYRLQLVRGGHTLHYVIRPQFQLGPGQGVQANTRADFMISLAGAEQEGQPEGQHKGPHEIQQEDEAKPVGDVGQEGQQGVDAEQEAAARDIAVYLDGYVYHATGENFRFHDDLRKREAIAGSGTIIPWTLTWSDIERFDAREIPSDAHSREFKRDSLYVDAVLYSDAIGKYKTIPYWKQYKSELISCRNSMERLLWLLERPFEADLEKKVALMLSLRQRSFARPSANENLLDAWLQDPDARMDPDRQAEHRQEGLFYVFPELPETVDVAVVKLAIRMADLQLRAAVYPTKKNESLDKEQWNSFWQVWNLVRVGEVIESEGGG